MNWMDDESGEMEKKAKLAALDDIGGILSRGMSSGINVHEITGDFDPHNSAGNSTGAISDSYAMSKSGGSMKPTTAGGSQIGLTKPPGVHSSQTPASAKGEDSNIKGDPTFAYGQAKFGVHEVSGDGNPDNEVGASVGDGGAHDDQNEKQAGPTTPMHEHNVGADSEAGPDDPEANSDEKDEDAGHGSPVGMSGAETGKAIIGFLKKNKHIK